MRSVTLVLMTMLLLTSCSTAASRALPDVIQYSKDKQRLAAYELTNNNVPTLMEFIKDYKVMRDQTRSLKDDK